MKQNVIIAAGGTGGHLYPGIALARELRGRGLEVTFIVRTEDRCIDILKTESFPYREIPVRGMPRKLSPAIFAFAFRQAKGFFAAKHILGEMKPVAVVGMGGYISFPAVVAAKLSGIPAVIHEQNYIPGLSNKILSRVADRVAVSFPETIQYFPKKKTTVTGNPVRTELFTVSRDEATKKLGLAPDRFTILVFGGSQGASGINKAVANAYALLGSLKERIQFLHIAGPKEYEVVAREHEARNIPGIVLPYLHTIGEAYAAADVILCRAGATTIAELSVLGAPSILVPFPYATANHQEYNARSLAKRGNAVVIRESELTADALAGSLTATIASAGGKRRGTITLPSPLPQQRLADEIAALKK